MQWFTVCKVLRYSEYEKNFWKQHGFKYMYIAT